jgi:uncharacterized protein
MLEQAIERRYTDGEAEVVRKTEEFVREKLASESSGHDWWHIHRVRNNAMSIAAGEGASAYIVELAALLHDIADWKFHGGDMEAGLGVDEAVIAPVTEIIATVSYKGAGVATPMRTREGMCVQDGDRLDAIGAIGIGRTFAYGGHAGRPMHDPEQGPEMHQSFEAYKASSGPTTNHFYEKLLLLKDRMNTETARQLAEGRHSYMEEFLQRFYAEWDGRA